MTQLTLDYMEAHKDVKGQKCLEQFDKFNGVGLWAKTYANLLISQDWSSNRCKLTWKLRSSKSHRFYFQLMPTEGGVTLTDLKEGGMLPTPTAYDWNSARTEKKWEEDKVKWAKKGVNLQMPLKQMARFKMLPTPIVSDRNAGRRGNAPRNNHNPMTNNLRDAVNYIEETSKCSHLNPQFVLEMMGFPTDWTLLPFLNKEICN